LMLPSPSMTKSQHVESGKYFRMQARYTHGDEPVNFDYVVACRSRITVHVGNGVSVDPNFWPAYYYQVTKDGAALMIKTPFACDGQTTENGRAPKDLLPMIVWFDSVNDL